MKSSRAYYMSHILLRNEIYVNWNKFVEAFKLGPDEMKTYLVNMWNGIDNKYFKEGIIISDIDRKVSKEDFDISVEYINDILTILIVFPAVDSYMAQARAVAIALGKENVRYITLEVWTEQEIMLFEKYKDEQPLRYTVGEWELNGTDFEHINYGKLPEATMECFISCIKNNILK